MNILVIGRGGREHSLVKNIRASKQVDQLFVAPGNAGMAEEASCVPIEETDITGLITFAKEQSINLTIVGPENPLMLGIANRFQEENLPIFAPTKEAAHLEGSKQFAKAFMNRHDIPTAAHAIFNDADKAKAYIREIGAPIVVKADGLAAGKGVVVAETVDAACQSVDSMMVDKTFAEAGSTIVIEECLVGKEFSLMAFVHGRNFYPMVPARDHKRAYDNDQGPNTGGMGAFAPVPDVTDETVEYVTKHVLEKACNGMVDEGTAFTGILYAGLIMTVNGPKVIEFNTRFGDPETQVVLPLLENDILQVINDVLTGENPHITWNREAACVGVVVAAKGYPGKYEKNKPIPTLLEQDGAFTIYAGVTSKKKELRSNGGRVLLVGAKGTTLEQARKATYDAVTPIQHSEHFFIRNDIATNIGDNNE